MDKELDKHKNSNFYVESYKLKNDKYYSDLKTPINNFSIDLDNLDFLSIKKEGSFIGYISLSKYKSDRDDQIKLCRDLLKLEQIKTRDEVFESYYDIDYDDSIKSFKSDFDINFSAVGIYGDYDNLQDFMADVKEFLLEDNKALRMNMNNLQKRLETLLSEMIDEVESVFEMYSSPLEEFAKFDNGETIYKKTVA